MFKRILSFLVMATISTTVFAQSNEETPSVSTAPLSSVAASKGIRVALIKPFLDFEAKAEAESLGVKKSVESELEKELGLSVGYAYLPIKKLGFIANGSLINMDNPKGKTMHMFRVDGNIAYTLNEYLYGKAGLNASTLTNDEYEDLSPSIGLQLGVGTQITKNIGLDVSYVMMQQRATYRFVGTKTEIELDWRQYGLEVGLHATF